MLGGSEGAVQARSAEVVRALVALRSEMILGAWVSVGGGGGGATMLWVVKVWLEDNPGLPAGSVARTR